MTVGYQPTSTLISEYRYFVYTIRFVIARASVSVPILPMYMVRMIIVFPAKLKEDVIPVDKPTVPNADISSNKRLIKLLSGSVIDNINVEIKISEIENNAI